MKLRCIGGPFAGHYVEVKKPQHGDAITVTSAKPARPGTASYEPTVYTVLRLSTCWFGRERVHFALCQPDTDPLDELLAAYGVADNPDDF